MPTNNISDWLSFLNERITSNEASQISKITLIEIICALIVAMLGILGTNLIVTGGNLPFLIAQSVFIIGLIIVGILVFFNYTKEKDAPESSYQQALQIRGRILEGTLVNPDDIYQECIDARILFNEWPEKYQYYWLKIKEIEGIPIEGRPFGKILDFGLNVIKISVWTLNPKPSEIRKMYYAKRSQIGEKITEKEIQDYEIWLHRI